MRGSVPALFDLFDRLADWVSEIVRSRRGRSDPSGQRIAIDITLAAKSDMVSDLTWSAKLVTVINLTLPGQRRTFGPIILKQRTRQHRRRDRHTRPSNTHTAGRECRDEVVHFLPSIHPTGH